jgi:hypothetical protein
VGTSGSLKMKQMKNNKLNTHLLFQNTEPIAILLTTTN